MGALAPEGMDVFVSKDSIRPPLNMIPRITPVTRRLRLTMRGVLPKGYPSHLRAKGPSHHSLGRTGSQTSAFARSSAATLVLALALALLPFHSAQRVNLLLPLPLLLPFWLSSRRDLLLHLPLFLSSPLGICFRTRSCLSLCHPRRDLLLHLPLFLSSSQGICFRTCSCLSGCHPL
jgi:hypothetical protein